MEQQKKVEVSSNQFSVNMKDLAKGLLMTVLGSVLTVVYTSLDAGSLDIDLKKAVIVGVTAGVSYILKNFFEPAQVRTVISNKEASEVRKAGVDPTSK